MDDIHDRKKILDHFTHDILHNRTKNNVGTVTINNVPNQMIVGT